MLDQITPLILTFNEAPNIRRTLDKLVWAQRIIVIDSGSTDGTLDILRACPKATVAHRQFDNFKAQWNYGLSLVTSYWVLSLDADYELSDELVEELRSLPPAPQTIGYRAQLVYRIHGRNLRGSLYPPRVVLFRHGQAEYRQEGHTQQLAIDGDVLPLRGRIYHDDRKPLSRWFASQQRYARDEAEHLLSQKTLSRADRLRRTGWAAPFAVFFYTLLVKRCLFDGWPGWFYTLQRLLAEILLALELIDRRLGGARNDANRAANG
ncbi:MAG TPA: glycosyltransferase family 2 protein [Stellaceae bacterium]|nr:glycosyltransferase family 2 protein [Stellaceae bacterium]